MQKSTDTKFILKKRGAAKLLPPVSSSDHKASRGRSLILAGSKDYPGAGILAAKAALRSGSGYVTLAQKHINISSLENPDFILCDLEHRSWREVPFDALLLGPGFGVNDFTAQTIRELKELGTKNVVLDADALTVCARERLFPLLPSWIVTPHSGELARCLNVSSEEIAVDRMQAITKAQELFQCVVLLKGHHTLIANRKRIFRNTTGNEALAKAGTGDVLAGIITAFRAQGLPPTAAAALGAYVHGATANLWVAQKKDVLSMTASDVIEYIPSVLHRLRHGA